PTRRSSELNAFILILAGYSAEMDEFLNSNPGLPSRFPIQVDFPDYVLDELMQIAELMMEKREYEFSAYARQKLKKHLQTMLSQSNRSFSNARHVRNLIEQSIRYQAVRLMKKSTPSKEDLITIGSDDLYCESSVARW